MSHPAESLQRAWLVLTFGDDRSYAGNLGYADDPRQMYQYDNFVQNYSNVSPGDVLVIRDRQSLLGLARVAEIRSSDGVKTRRRCPICDGTSFSERVHKRPRFRCSEGHEFEGPQTEAVPCTKFEAHLSGFVDARDAVSIEALRNACPRYSAQTSIQEIDPDGIRWGLDAEAPAAVALLPPPTIAVAKLPLSPDAASDSTPPPSRNTRLRADDEEFIPGGNDERRVVERAIRLRRGQAGFRRSLVNRYGSRCMVSGCTLFHIVEAAHIAPYRRRADHSAANGLLLRADLHTLYDLDLLGIDPVTLQIRVHPMAMVAGYSELDGVGLQCGDSRPSPGALAVRWKQFQERLQRDGKKLHRTSN